jgi:hypothetical protein
LGKPAAPKRKPTSSHPVPLRQGAKPTGAIPNTEVMTPVVATPRPWFNFQSLRHAEALPWKELARTGRCCPPWSSISRSWAHHFGRVFPIKKWVKGETIWNNN